MGEEYRHFSKEDIQIANRSLKDVKYANGNISVRYHPAPIKMPNIKNIRCKCWRGCKDEGILIHCRWECKLVQPLWKTVSRFLILKLELRYDPEIPPVGVYTKRNEIIIPKIYEYLHVHSSIIHNSLHIETS